MRSKIGGGTMRLVIICHAKFSPNKLQKAKLVSRCQMQRPVVLWSTGMWLMRCPEQSIYHRCCSVHTCSTHVAIHTCSNLSIIDVVVCIAHMCSNTSALQVELLYYSWQQTRGALWWDLAINTSTSTVRMGRDFGVLELYWVSSCALVMINSIHRREFSHIYACACVVFQLSSLICDKLPTQRLTYLHF